MRFFDLTFRLVLLPSLLLFTLYYLVKVLREDWKELWR